MSHVGYEGPGSYDGVVLYLCHAARNPKGARPGGIRAGIDFEPFRAGSRIVAADISGDSSNDVVVSASSGTIVFFNTVNPRVRPARTGRECP